MIIGFNEKQFRQLVDETQKTVVALGTTSPAVLYRQRRFAEKLINHLKSNNAPFEVDYCLEWLESLKPVEANASKTSYVDWIASRRLVMLLAEQEAGTLTAWRHYPRKSKVKMPKSKSFVEIVALYKTSLSDAELAETTISEYSSYVRGLLMFIENKGIYNVSDISNKDVAEYFVSPRFENRKPKGVQKEVCGLRNFLAFLSQHGHNTCKTLHYAMPYRRVPMQRIITTVTPEVVSDIMADISDSAINLRDKAVCFLALNVGLRSCDIRNLKFNDIDCEKGVITIKQSKTNVHLQVPMDNETQNAIIDYILNERRDCDLDYIFITSFGPAKKLAFNCFRIKYRTKGTASFDKIPHDGLHILRRTYASRLLKSGTPLSMISKMLGHIDMNAVQHYLSTEEVKMKRCALDLSLIPYRKGDF